MEITLTVNGGEHRADVAVPPFPVEKSHPETVADRPMKNYVDWIARLVQERHPLGEPPLGTGAS